MNTNLQTTNRREDSRQNLRLTSAAKKPLALALAFFMAFSLFLYSPLGKFLGYTADEAYAAPSSGIDYSAMTAWRIDLASMSNNMTVTINADGSYKIAASTGMTMTSGTGITGGGVVSTPVAINNHVFDITKDYLVLCKSTKGNVAYPVRFDNGAASLGDPFGLVLDGVSIVLGTTAQQNDMDLDLQFYGQNTLRSANALKSFDCIYLGSPALNGSQADDPATYSNRLSLVNTNLSSAGEIVMNGGYVETDAAHPLAPANEFKVYGGILNAKNSTSALPGINAAHGVIICEDAIVYATGGSNAAAIGGASDSNYNITIQDNAKVYATGIIGTPAGSSSATQKITISNDATLATPAGDVVPLRIAGSGQSQIAVLNVTAPVGTISAINGAVNLSRAYIEGDVNAQTGSINDSYVTGVVNGNILIQNSRIGVDPPVISGNPDIGYVGTPYYDTLEATGSKAVWTKTAGDLPLGLTLNSSGIISGTPTTVETTTFSATATNDKGTSTKELTLIIEPAQIGPPQITTATTLPGAKLNESYNQLLEATGAQPIRWDVISGTFPAGLTLSAIGLITGTPTAIGEYTFTATAANARDTDRRTFSISVARAFAHGDVNGDGEIDSADVIYLAHCVAEEPGYELPLEVADINRDGEVDSADVIYLARAVAEMPGYPL